MLKVKILALILITAVATAAQQRVVSHEANPATGNLRLYLKDAAGRPLKNHGGLRHMLDSLGYDLVFAMNGGMFNTALDPIGLYIENGTTIKSINTVKSGYGNFHMQPNGVFYITMAGVAAVVTTDAYAKAKDVRYATQSGPMLLIDGDIHPQFRQGSANLNIRNGVGILPNGHVLFAMSTEMINFYDFAAWFKERGCTNALYLDGFVSRMFLPDEGVRQVTGSFGAIIAEVKKR